MYANWEKNPEEPINPKDEIMTKDTCYLTDEETKIRNEIIEEKIGKTVMIEVRQVEEGRRFEESFVDIEKIVHMDLTIED